MIILQISGPKAYFDLTDHICQNGLKVCSEVCFLAIEFIGISDRICFIFLAEHSGIFTPTIISHSNYHSALRIKFK